MRIVLHDYWRSSASYRVRICLGLKGVPHTRVPVNLATGEQRGAENRAVNPQAMVPTLVVDGRAIVQSLAIIDWLDAAFPDPPLLAMDPFTRADQRARALVIAADIHPIDNLRVLKRLEAQFGADQAARDAWYGHWIAAGFAALEEMAGFAALEEMAGAGPFLGGAAPDLSDVCLVPQLANARRVDLPLDRYPRLLAAEAAMLALPAVQAAHPDRVRPA